MTMDDCDRDAVMMPTVKSGPLRPETGGLRRYGRCAGALAFVVALRLDSEPPARRVGRLQGELSL